MNRRHALASLAALSTLAATACGDHAAGPVSEAHAQDAAKPAPREAYTLAAQGNGFVRGPLMAAHTVYVFFDPTCPHCAELWEAAKPLLGRAKLVWMPVGILRSSSGPQGATILSAPDPAAAMAENEAGVLARKGGITVSPTLSAEALAKVKANTDLFMRLGADSVPLIVFKNGRSGEYGMHAGFVDTAGLVALAGL